MEGRLADDDKDDLDVLDQDAGVAFRIEMWTTDMLLRYWKQLVAAVVVTLLAILVYGQWRNLYQADQRASTSAIADVESELPADLYTLSLQKSGRLPGKDVDVAAVEDAGEELLRIAQGASGTASVEAALKAAELFRLAGDDAQRRSALAMAADGGTGVLRYAAEAGLANLDIEEGNADAAIARFRELQGEDGYLARQATLDLATALEALDRSGEAVAAYDEYLRRWPDAKDAAEVQQRRERAAASGTDG